MTRILDAFYAAVEIPMRFLQRHPVLNAALFVGLILMPLYAWVLLPLARRALRLLFP